MIDLLHLGGPGAVLEQLLGDLFGLLLVADDLRAARGGVAKRRGWNKSSRERRQRRVVNCVDGVARGARLSLAQDAKAGVMTLSTPSSAVGPTSATAARPTDLVRTHPWAARRQLALGIATKLPTRNSVEILVCLSMQNNTRRLIAKRKGCPRTRTRRRPSTRRGTPQRLRRPSSPTSRGEAARRRLTHSPGARNPRPSPASDVSRARPTGDDDGRGQRQRPRRAAAEEVGGIPPAAASRNYIET